jgi:hypothetical protein
VEKQFMSDRLALDRDGCSHEFKYKFAKHALLDWKIWVVSRYPAVSVDLG